LSTKKGCLAGSQLSLLPPMRGGKWDQPWPSTMRSPPRLFDVLVLSNLTQTVGIWFTTKRPRRVWNAFNSALWKLCHN
jgi:hypothetical protein